MTREENTVLKMNIVGGLYEYAKDTYYEERIVKNGYPRAPTEEDLKVIAENEISFLEFLRLF